MTELVCLRHGLELLRGVYNDLDVRLLGERKGPVLENGTFGENPR
ncbi:MAG: hypothetical protein ABW110_00410 [Steroidobacteraceae bacterium]